MQLLSESLDVIRDQEWTISMGNAFTKHYDLYVGDNQHSALLHRFVSNIYCTRVVAHVPIRETFMEYPVSFISAVSSLHSFDYCKDVEVFLNRRRIKFLLRTVFGSRSEQFCNGFRRFLC